jgi:molybdopterin/thiamine biosynthesis adenylyltransferase
MRHAHIDKVRVEQAKRTILEISPDVEVDICDERTSEGNVERLLEGANVALSARPNFHERRILNEACVKKGIPMVEAAMNAMEGYLFNVIPGVTPCLNCVYPEDNPEWEELGFPVLGAVSGALGCLMAIEAIKILTGFGKPLSSEMLVFDASDMTFNKFKTRRDENCRVCALPGQS